MVSPADDELAGAGAASSTDAPTPKAADTPPRPKLRPLTHERLERFGLSPKKALGQNFLVSDHVLQKILELAPLEDGDVALEIGGGLGILTERLAERAAHTHVIELDERLADVLEELCPPPTVTVHRGDAVRVDLTSLDPLPTTLVANLPYGVAATVVLRVAHELPTVRGGLVMVQKEVGARFAARPGSKTYGAPSALLQLCAMVKLERDVPPSSFLPRPHVDSTLMRFTRTGPPPERGLIRLVQGAFAHRRKALPKSLAISIGDPRTRDAAREALVAIGCAEDARAEQLSADQFRALHGQLVAAGIGGLA